MTTVSPLIRAAVFVSDLERSVAFYTDILGYEEVFFDGELDDPVVNVLLGMPDSSRTRARILKQSGPEVGMLGLFEVTGPAPPPLEPAGRGCHIGQVCMVFYCADLDETRAKLAAHGVTIVAEPQVLHISGRAGPGNREMTFLGPDGEMLNFIERDPLPKS
jgi:catechol 2,3-dioxygenase-like lactoylglutathione lyase family enzyme